MDPFKVLSDLFNEYQSTLHEATIELRHARNRESALKRELASSQLMNVDEALQYLRIKDADMLNYYEKRGLPCYRKGKLGRWFLKKEIDEWLAKGKVNKCID